MHNTQQNFFLDSRVTKNSHSSHTPNTCLLIKWSNTIKLLFIHCKLLNWVLILQLLTCDITNGKVVVRLYYTHSLLPCAMEFLYTAMVIKETILEYKTITRISLNTSQQKLKDLRDQIISDLSSCRKYHKALQLLQGSATTKKSWLFGLEFEASIKVNVILALFI